MEANSDKISEQLTTINNPVMLLIYNDMIKDNLIQDDKTEEDLIGKFVALDGHTYTISKANADQFFKYINNYMEIKMMLIAYQMENPDQLNNIKQKFYYPDGLKINLALDFFRISF